MPLYSQYQISVYYLIIQVSQFHLTLNYSFIIIHLNWLAIHFFNQSFVTILEAFQSL